MHAPVYVCWGGIASYVGKACVCQEIGAILASWEAESSAIFLASSLSSGAPVSSLSLP